MTTRDPLPDLLASCRGALADAEALLDEARRAVAGLVGTGGGKIDPAALDRHQVAVHGFAWMATTVEGLRQMLGWAERLEAAGRLGTLEALLLQLAFGEYLAQLAGGIPVSQVEIVRPADLGLDAAALARFRTPEVERLAAAGAAASVRTAVAELLHPGAFGDDGIGAGEDEVLGPIRDQVARFAAERVAPHAQAWHREDALIPDDVIAGMAGLGVFALTIPEEHGGLGLGKTAMCVVSEELCAASLAVGSLGTRTEIAAELIRLAGTPGQKSRWLPRLASGEVLPTAVFTEPGSGSDLASLATRAVRNGAVYRVHGAKTWATHAARADLMTLLVRTGPPGSGHRGLSMLLAAKPRGTGADPFPAAGMTGSEIPVLGYRGMKEYEIAFDGFEVPAEGLLGAAEGEGFRQLMETFESARIQTAARAVGVARHALALGLDYARGRTQFSRPLIAFPRVSAKLGWMAAETMVARQLTWHAARAKDSGRRCDVEAGMAKLLAARVAWAGADAAVQIHGGNGYALEYEVSRVLCDARILSIFEGAAEIQAHVVARGLLTRN